MQQAPQGNPYEFITNPGQPPKSPLLGGSTKSRIFIVVGAIFLLLILFGIASTILSSGKNASTVALKNVIAEQEELIRISDIGFKDALGTEARGYAITVSLTMKTSQQELTERLTATKAKMNAIDLKAKNNPKTDEALTAAQASNRYDEALTEALNDNLSKYMKDLKSTYNSTGSEKTKAALNKAYDNAAILLKTTTKTE